MSLDYETYPLKELNEGASVFSGFAFKSKDFSDEGIPIVKIKNIQNKSVDLKEVQYFPLDKVNNKHKKFFLKNNDVLIAMTGQGSLGRVGRINLESNEYVLLNQRVGKFVVDEKNLHLNYLYHVISSDMYEKILFDRGTGSGQPNLSPEIILGTEIPMPNLTTQKKISSILDNINSKINLNKKINKNLDNLLMSIFNSWFINFEVYDKSNGMKFDETFGDVPRLWSVEMLEDYVDFVTGVEPGSKNYHEKPEINDIPFIRVGDLGSRINTVFIDKLLSKNKILSPDDITLSLDATVGIVKMGLNGAYSTGMRKLLIKNDDINKPFLYCLVKSKRIQRIIETFATGTTILHAGKSIKHMNFVLSDEQTMNQFGKIGNPILSIILANLKEINKLTKLRDTLLPKLMSGEIDVSKINCDLKIIIRKIYIKSFKLFLWRYLIENKNYIKNTKSNETLLKSRTIYQINKFLAKFNARYRYYRQ